METGKDVGGESLLIGRALSGNNLVPGKIQPSQNCIKLTWNGPIVEKQEFEVLTVDTKNGKSVFTDPSKKFLFEFISYVIHPRETFVEILFFENESQWTNVDNYHLLWMTDIVWDR
jgi:Protein of unknown function (DUF3421)